MRRLIAGAALLGAACLSLGLWITRADPLPAGIYDDLAGDAARGEAVFWAGGCASCHMAPEAEGDAQLVLTGGQAFPSDFGTFYAPNVSMHPEDGIGAWTADEFASAVQRGVSPEGAHYFPVFPYAAYRLANPQDIVDLWAFWQTLPAAEGARPAHDIAFPFSIRRGVGVWKQLYGSADFTGPGPEADVERGRYLAEALSHCAECHTPRTALGGLDRSRWMAGAPNPSGPGRIPNITPAELTWSEDEIEAYLTDGFTPEFDVAAGHMRHVVENLARLPDGDRAAIAAYLKALPPRE
ncbi:cytochrome c [uncultured Jannaschia sp.]|uniref:c-type cytochrome n=1 Tax=uncultured Jannaschia sp. TaxID=293347 RepID=UPI00262EA758|nr:cytochrome c [uncultured Jannaschia sp.]